MRSILTEGIVVMDSFFKTDASIICQEDIYFKELVRYIHLNPLRAKIVLDINPVFSRDWATQEQGILARRRSILLRGLNNAVPVLFRLAFGEEFIFYWYDIHQNRVSLIKGTRV